MERQPEISGDLADKSPNPEPDELYELRVHLSHPYAGSETLVLTMSEVERAVANGCIIHSITSVRKPPVG